MKLSLTQKIALVKFLQDALKALREDDLLPQAAKEMPSGSRMPVIFAGEHAGFVTMPEGSRSAVVTDERALLAWAEKNHPDWVEDHAEVAVDDDLIAFLAEARPEALRRSRRVDPQRLSDLCHGLKSPGYYVTGTGEKLTEIPGLKAGTSTPVPRVNLNDHAANLIRAAWQAGQIPADELVALPAPERGAA